MTQSTIERFCYLSIIQTALEEVQNQYSMKRTFLLLCSCMFFMFVDAQTKPQLIDLAKKDAEIVAEGKKLYYLQMATTLGLESFMQLPNDVIKNALGYFAYQEGKFYKCVFFNHLGDAQIVSTISFDSSFNKLRTAINTTLRPMTEAEKNLYFMRQRSLDEIKADTAFFKIYTNTSTIILPMIDNNERRVFVLTKSEDPASVIFGNDYVLNFDRTNYMSAKKAIHNDIIIIDCVAKNSEEDEDLSAIMHKHEGESGEFITATDVCALLMNEKKAGWLHHVVKSQNYVSVWFCDTDELETMPVKKWNKYNKAEEKDPVNKEEKEKKQRPVAANSPYKREQQLWASEKEMITVPVMR